MSSNTDTNTSIQLVEDSNNTTGTQSIGKITLVPHGTMTSVDPKQAPKQKKAQGKGKDKGNSNYVEQGGAMEPAEQLHMGCVKRQMLGKWKKGQTCLGSTFVIVPWGWWVVTGHLFFIAMQCKSLAHLGASSVVAVFNQLLEGLQLLEDMV
ncbi:hypothetical protein BKA83DRAFT_4128956 [Pisolithus microcarpus]|nr:hypothetical protein BKA83DRAFT_4128956 [Pisolithus microcarpus]